MVAEVRAGRSVREVAAVFGVSKSTVDRWVARAAGKRLDRVDWSDQPSGRRIAANRTPKEVERLVLALRRELKETSALGEHGAETIRGEMVRRRCPAIPSVRTINRILKRWGQFDGSRRVRRPPPPRGWYLPRVAAAESELDCFDIVEGLVLEGGRSVELLNGISLHGGLVASWPRAKITANAVLGALLRHWREFGMPDYVQFDNDTVFQGPRKADSLGRVSRMCLWLGVIPVFVPPHETGFQATIENYNGRWQKYVWNRFHFDSRQQLLAQSDKFVRAARRRHAERIGEAPARWEIPPEWTIEHPYPTEGMMIFLRRTNDRGHATLLGRSLQVSASWPHRLVRAEVHFSDHQIHFYALRRREPDYQPLLKTVPYQLPQRRFQ
jgi:putative transposase